MGEASTNLAFLLSRERGAAPRQVAESLVEPFEPAQFRFIDRIEVAGAGFINFFLNYEEFLPFAVEAIEASSAEFGRPADLTRLRILIEHTAVNPNKEWHVGHLRNAVIGDVLVRAARLAGHDVEVQNYIDDTGRQVAEAIYALERYGASSASDCQKYDQYVGSYYVRVNAELAEASEGSRHQELDAGITRTLHELESGAHRGQVERIVRAQLETAKRLGAEYDLLVWESDIVQARLLDEALESLKRSPRVYVPTEGEYLGALVIEVPPGSGSEEESDEKLLRVLVRSNGLPTYTGKDMAYMMWKFGLLKERLRRCIWDTGAPGPVWTTCPDGDVFDPRPPDRVINVVGEHQALQQQTVLEGLAAAGFEDEARRAEHFSYGMVREKTGRIQGRRGSGASADEILDEALEVAVQRVNEKQSDTEAAERRAVAEAIAVGAVRYLMVQYSPPKPIVFDMHDVVSFEGNTGLYIQYALVRMNAVLRRATKDLGLGSEDIRGGDLALLQSEPERRLVLKLARFPHAVESTLRTLGVNLVAEYAHELAAEFSQFYRDCPILSAPEELRLARLRLVTATRRVLTNVAGVIGIPVVDYL